MEYREKKILTEAEINILMENPYIVKVINQKVYYSERFWQVGLLMKLQGKSVRDFLDHIDVSREIIGSRRVRDINTKLNTMRRKFEAATGMSKAESLDNAQLTAEINNLKSENRKQQAECRILFNKSGYYEALIRLIKKNAFFISCACQKRWQSSLFRRGV